MAEARVTIGSVVSTNPARREVRVKPLPAQHRQFKNRTWVKFRLGDGQDVRCKVDAIREAPDAFCLTLGAGVPRDVVGRLRKALVQIEASESTPRASGAFDVQALVGCALVGAGDRVLGVVVAALEAPANDVLRAQLDDGRTVWLPAVEALITGIDLEGKRVYVNDLAPYAVDDAR